MGVILNYVLPVLGIIAIIAAIVVYTFWLNKRMGGGKDGTDIRHDKQTQKDIKPKLFGPFMLRNQQVFFEAMKKSLPSHYVVIPNVAIELLFDKGQRDDLQMGDEYADVAVFTENYLPVLVIDLVDYSPSGKAVFHLSLDAKDMLRSVGVNVLEYNIRDTYSVDELRKAVAKATNPLYS